MNITKLLIKSLIALILILSQAQATSKTVYYHHDALGSIVSSTDENGEILWNEEYQPYGEKINDIGNGDNVDNPDWYTGKNYDKELDISYFGARWYDAKQGRFLSIDPVGVDPENLHSFNRYAYANNNPYKYVDPDGEFAILALVVAYATFNIINDSINAYQANTSIFDKGINGNALSAAAVAGIKSAAENIGPPGKGVLVKATNSSGKEITKSSRKRVKRLIKNLSDNSRQKNGLSQEKTDQLRRIVVKAGGRLRNDGVSGVKGSSAGKPHVQTEGLGKSIDSRHIWTQGGVQ